MTMCAAKPMPDIIYLNKIFRIQDGKLYWNAVRCGTKLGSECGNKNSKGYRRVKINGLLYLVHRVIFYMSTGTDPLGKEIDHADGNPENNMPSNLRMAEHGQNQANGKAYKSSSTKLRGVSWHKQHRKYVASIQHEKVSYHLGLFPDKNDAARAYNFKALELFGEFARINQGV